MYIYVVNNSRLIIHHSVFIPMKMPHTTGLTNSNKHSAVTEPKWDDTPSSYKSLVIINSTFFMQTKSLQSPSSFNPKIGMLMVHPKIAMVNCHPSPWAPWRPGPTRPHSVTNEIGRASCRERV